MCIRVDLPEPDGPITATSSPGWTDRETPREGVHGGVARAVAPGDVAGHDDRAAVVVHAGRSGCGGSGESACHWEPPEGWVLMTATLWRPRGRAIGRRPDRGPARGWSFGARGSPSRRRPSSRRVTRTIRAADAAVGGAGYRQSVRFRRFIEDHGLDAMIVVLFVLAEIELWVSDTVSGPKPVLVVGAALWTLPVLARRRFPFAAPAAAVVAVIVEALIAPEAISDSVASVLLVLVLGAVFGQQGFTARGVGGWALLMTVIAVVVVKDPSGSTSDLLPIGAIATVSLAHRARLPRAQPADDRAGGARRAARARA